MKIIKIMEGSSSNMGRHSSPTAPPPRMPRSSPVEETHHSFNHANHTHTILNNDTLDSSSRFNPFEGVAVEPVSERVIRAGLHLQKLNVRFGGESNENADEFLRTIKDTIQLYSITEGETFELISFALKMPALGWYRVEKSTFRNYREFIYHFRLRFSSMHTQTRLWDEIWARTQGLSEPVAEYLTKMQILFSYLDNPLPMSQQMEILFRNLNPEMMKYFNLTQANNYHEFLCHGREIERKIELMAKYKPPPLPENSYIRSAACSVNGKRDSPEVKGLCAAEAYENEENSGCEMIIETPTSSPEPDVLSQISDAGRNKPEKSQVQRDEGKRTESGAKYGNSCFNCGQMGHFTKICPLRNRELEYVGCCSMEEEETWKSRTKMKCPEKIRRMQPLLNEREKKKNPEIIKRPCKGSSNSPDHLPKTIINADSELTEKSLKYCHSCGARGIEKTSCQRCRGKWRYITPPASRIKSQEEQKN